MSPPMFPFIYMALPETYEFGNSLRDSLQMQTPPQLIRGQQLIALSQTTSLSSSLLSRVRFLLQSRYSNQKELSVVLKCVALHRTADGFQSPDNSIWEFLLSYLCSMWRTAERKTENPHALMLWRQDKEDGKSDEAGRRQMAAHSWLCLLNYSIIGQLNQGARWQRIRWALSHCVWGCARLLPLVSTHLQLIRS